MKAKRRIGILTGGGDCPGLNAVIRAVVRTAITGGLEVLGVINGFGGLVEDWTRPLNEEAVSGILPRGGTILGTTNRDNPFHYQVKTDDGEAYRDESARVLANLKRHKIEGLIIIGGDGSLNIASQFSALGVPLVGVPKTIDNDIAHTERTFGFDTAMMVATEALDRLHTTAESHHRVMVLEVMGRYAGWIALHSGIAGGANCILIPEIPYKLDRVVEHIKDRAARGKAFSIVVVAEGAKPVGGDITIARRVEGSFESIRLGGIGDKLACQLEDLTGMEARCTVLGHVQRGGTPTPYDRVLSTRYGVAAVEAYLRGEYGVMVALQQNKIVTVPLSNIADQPSNVPPDGELVHVARSVGVVFGNE